MVLFFPTTDLDLYLFLSRLQEPYLPVYFVQYSVLLFESSLNVRPWWLQKVQPCVLSLVRTLCGLTVTGRKQQQEGCVLSSSAIKSPLVAERRTSHCVLLSLDSQQHVSRGHWIIVGAYSHP